MKSTPSTVAKKRRRRLPGWLISIFLGVLLGVLIIAGKPVLRVLSGGKLFGQQVVAPPLKGRTAFNVLIIGLDQPDRLHPERGRRSDSLILARVDVPTEMVAGISIPRDTRVKLPNKPGWTKVNSSYIEDGPQGTMAAIQAITGVPIDYYVVVDTSSTKALVDSVGGVQVNVEKRMKYDDSWQDLHIDLKPGLQWLNGDQAVGYVRFRHDATGDIARMGRQQKFIRAIAGRLMAPENLPKLPRILPELRRQVNTNMEETDLLFLARTFRTAPASHLEFHTLTGENRTIGGLDYFLPYGDKMRERILQIFPGVTIPDDGNIDTVGG